MFVGSGGEDDLVAVYSVADGQVPPDGILYFSQLKHKFVIESYLTSSCMCFKHVAIPLHQLPPHTGSPLTSDFQDTKQCCCLCLILQVVAFGEGHNSWVSRVAFDPYSCRDTRSSTSIGPAAAANQLHEKLYRLGSVGQDTTMCLWDLVEVVEDSYHGSSGCAQTGGLK